MYSFCTCENVRMHARMRVRMRARIRKRVCECSDMQLYSNALCMKIDTYMNMQAQRNTHTHTHTHAQTKTNTPAAHTHKHSHTPGTSAMGSSLVSFWGAGLRERGPLESRALVQHPHQLGSLSLDWSRYLHSTPAATPTSCRGHGPAASCANTEPL